MQCAPATTGVSHDAESSSRETAIRASSIRRPGTRGADPAIDLESQSHLEPGSGRPQRGRCSALLLRAFSRGIPTAARARYRTGGGPDSRPRASGVGRASAFPGPVAGRGRVFRCNREPTLPVARNRQRPASGEQLRPAAGRFEQTGPAPARRLPRCQVPWPASSVLVKVPEVSGWSRAPRPAPSPSRHR